MFPEFPGSLVSRASYNRHTLVLKSFAALFPVPSAKTAITLGIGPSAESPCACAARRAESRESQHTEGAAGARQVTRLLRFGTRLQHACTAGSGGLPPRLGSPP